MKILKDIAYLFLAGISIILIVPAAILAIPSIHLMAIAEIISPHKVTSKEEFSCPKCGNKEF